jgi:hypothetical protein
MHIIFDTFHWAQSLPLIQLIPSILFVYILAAALFALCMLPIQDDIVFDSDLGVDNGYERTFYFSTSYLISLGCEYGFPNSFRMHALCMIAQLCGILMNFVLFGVLLSKFTRKSSSLILSESVVLSRVNGSPALTFRVAHVRGLTIVQPNLQVSMVCMKNLQDKGSTERMGTAFPLRIAGGGRHAACPPSYYFTHFIDSESPFFDAHSPSGTIFDHVFSRSTADMSGSEKRNLDVGIHISDEMIRAALPMVHTSIDRQLYRPFLLKVSCVARADDQDGQWLVASTAYTLPDITPNHRFQDCLVRTPGIPPQVDLAKFHTVFPLVSLDGEQQGKKVKRKEGKKGWSA